MYMTSEHMMAYAARPDAERGLLQAAVGEGTLAPVRSEELWIPMVLLDESVIHRVLGRWVVASVVGACLGYAAGYVVSMVALRMLAGTLAADVFAQLQGLLAVYGFVAALAGGFSPLPLKAVALACGVVQVNPLLFVAGMLLARLGRYALISALIWRGGPVGKEWVERNFYPVSMMMAIAGVMVFVLGRLLWVKLGL